VDDDTASFGSYMGVDYAERSTKRGRDSGLTMIMDQGWPNSFVVGMLEQFAEYVDIVKLWDPHVRVPVRTVREKVEIYKDHGVTVQPGGLIFELARQQGRYEQTLERVRGLGFDAIEISNTTSTRSDDLGADAEAIKLAKAMGFRIFGEVGRKFADGDETRLDEKTLDIEATVKEFQALLASGAERVYWEGHLLRMVMGDEPSEIHAQAATGTQQVITVANRVGAQNIMFEVSGLRPRANRQWLQFWLVRLFGPEVNIANARIEEMANLEAIRAGSHPIFGFGSAGNYAWLRAYGEGRSDWWRG
jgi:phosphosulfolactate synthase